MTLQPDQRRECQVGSLPPLARSAVYVLTNSNRQSRRIGSRSRLSRLSVSVLNRLPGVGQHTNHTGRQYADNIGLSIFYIVYALTEGVSSRPIRFAASKLTIFSHFSSCESYTTSVPSHP